MAKYDPLREYLCGNGGRRIGMSFDQIARLVDGLPRSAYEYEAWWSNELQPRTHVQKHAWMAAGYEVERFNLATKTVTFRRR